METLTFEAIGTVWNIELPELDADTRERVMAKVMARIDAFDAAYSRFRADSLVTKMSAEGGTHTLPDDAQPMLALYRELYDITDGAVTPLIGQTLSDAGYDAAYDFGKADSAKLTAPPTWEDTLSYDAPSLTLQAPALLDFGAAGKGYLVDLVAKVLRDEGLTAFVINAGGDIRIEGDDALPVALEHPEDATQAIGVATLKNQSICASSGSRRAWGRYHHILDPRTLSSPRDVLAVWVVADTTMLADALATGLYFAPPEAFGAYAFEYLILLPDHSVRHSPGFPADLFS